MPSALNNITTFFKYSDNSFTRTVIYDVWEPLNKFEDEKKQSTLDALKLLTNTRTIIFT